jgi:hypothetical protein
MNHSPLTGMSHSDKVRHQHCETQCSHRTQGGSSLYGFGWIVLQPPMAWIVAST